MTPAGSPRWYSPPLSVVGFVASRKGDEQRGPLVWMRPDDALIRLLSEGELVRVISPRRQELAVLALDETLSRGCIVVRDVLGVSVSEIVRVVKPDFDAPDSPVRRA